MVKSWRRWRDDHHPCRWHGLDRAGARAGLVARGHRVVVLTRSAEKRVAGAEMAVWDGRSIDASLLDGVRGIVNLAGESVGEGRWTRQRKRAILRSRVDATAALVAGIGRLAPERRPRVLVNASGIDYGGDMGEAEVREDVAPGGSFLASVCVHWETTALAAEAFGTRVVLMRIPFVVARQAPALRLLARPFRLFVGGRFGSGRQWFPWIHIDDLTELISLAIEDDALRGPVNAVAPELVRQRELACALGSVLGRPAIVPTPGWVFRLALGQQSDLVLRGQRAVGTKALEAGYAFRYPELGRALEESLR